MSKYPDVILQKNQKNDTEYNINVSHRCSQVDSGSVIQKQPEVHKLASGTSSEEGDWMPAPEHIPNNCPDALKYLLMVDQLNIIQKVNLIKSLLGHEKNNTYTIVNKVGQKMFYAVKDIDHPTFNCCGSARVLEIEIMDSQGNEIIHLSRSHACDPCLFSCCLQKIEVYSPPGCLIGTVEQDWSLFTPMFTIRNALYEEVLKIKGPVCHLICGCEIDYKVLSKGKTCEVGRISKQWTGFVSEWCMNADNIGISFPVDLDVHMKAVMIGACFLIDFMFSESIQWYE